MEAFNFTVANLKNVIFFLLPGVIFISLFSYQIPDRKKSDFKLILWSVVTSALLNLFLVWILSIFKLKLDDLTLFIFSIAYSFIIAILAADFVRSKHFIRFNDKIFGIHYYPFGRLWNAYFEVKKFTIVRVSLQDGLSYIGHLKRVSIDPNDDKQELEIDKLYAYDKSTAQYKKIDETESMLIRGDAITTVEKIEEQAARQLYNF
jgi:small nuclear ribonucleoprotein (snRNP)-like protein